MLRNGSGSDPVYNYEYTLTDHLGNGRVYFDIYSGAARKIQEEDYYAFGLAIQVGSISGTENKYQYNGKEKQDEVKMLDYGARFYDAVVGRWNGVDPLGEGMIEWSPYNYAFNNPVIFIDKDGTVPDITIRGENNSSVTIKTDLINVDVNASSLGVDFGGNYTFAGSDILQAGLDIVGVFDPSGVADALSAKMSWDQGDYWGAAASAAGALPILVGDIAKIGKIGKALDKFGDAIKAADKTSDLAKAESRAAKLSKVQRPGEKFTKAGKDAVIDVNKAKNNGKTICVTCKTETIPGKKDKSGIRPPDNRTEIDHRKRKRDGGSGTPDNGDVNCRSCNQKKH